MRCVAHPKVETNLRCGKCGKPICPKCMVQTPVGARCPECARLYKLPTYRVSSAYYLRAVGTALGMATVCGVIWGLANLILPFFFLNLLLGAVIGYAISEVVGLAVNRKRGGGLATVAGAGVVTSYLISLSFPLVLPIGSFGLPLNFFSILLAIASVGLGIFVAITRLR